MNVITSLITTPLGIWLNHWLGMVAGNSLWSLAVSRKSSASVPMFGLFVYAVLIIPGIIILIFFALKLRHWVLDNDDSDDSDENGGFFSIAQLRDLRDRGAISNEEYESAKRVLVAQSLAMLSRSPTDN